MVGTLPSNEEGEGSIPGQGAKIPHDLWPKNQNIKQKQYCNKFNKDFKNGPHQKIFLKSLEEKKIDRFLPYRSSIFKVILLEGVSLK